MGVGPAAGTKKGVSSFDSVWVSSSPLGPTIGQFPAAEAVAIATAAAAAEAIVSSDI